MSRLNQVAISLYPRWWRDRYGAEFAVLVDDARPDLAGTLDICKGALAMQASTRSPKRLIVIFAIAGLLVASGFAVSMKDQYQSAATISIVPAVGPTPQTALSTQDDAVIKAINVAAGKALSTVALFNIIRTQGLYSKDLNSTPPPTIDVFSDVLQRMRQSIQIVPLSAPMNYAPVFQVRFTNPDVTRGERATESLAREIVKAGGSSTEGPNPLRLEFLKLTTSPHPISPNRTLLAFSGLAGGIATGGFLSGVVWATRKIKSRKSPSPAAA